ncbi:beta-hexosaminidase [Pseudozyma hubeiensis SY62]|uniref:beta-N-acetylhexosaminidase n=1 Tax=Pseudozyma hubeiensis (strain SY62) TaxID=1305764 RepID=R9PDJ6_PSEHS|nr:beta-hexosaminidase [Pseudozyma hubeiensis SY62]GAC99453.1 beta-hexosaminidase [Pseudozyma hubeiensis SY62]
MWYCRTATLLASACLVGALSANALWPHPTNYTAGKDDTFVRISSDLSFQLVDGTDQSRVPDDLTQAITDSAKLANTIDVWELTPDRGESHRDGVGKAALIASVQIKVLELMPETTPNLCVEPSKSVGTVENSMLQLRALQQPFQGRGDAIDDPLQNRQSENEEYIAVEDNRSNVWSNACSISSRAIKQLSYNVSSKPLNLETDKSAPSDLGNLDAEMYRLSVPSDGASIQLTSYTSIGALRGLQTLMQLIYALPPLQGGKVQSQHYISNVPITIEDRPGYPYRGLMLDTARNWFDLATIRKLIDSMSFVKLNQLHWHGTDTQSWPLAFNKDGSDPDLSVLAETGSYGWYQSENGTVEKMVYTEEDVEYIVGYAAERGINVIIETDMPAHMLSGVEAIDGGSLMACPEQLDWITVAAEPPSGQLRIVSNSTESDTTDINTFKIPDAIVKLVSAILRKTSSLSKSLYVSSGGDEPNFHCWNLSSEAAMEPYLRPFMELVTNVTAAAGKRGLVWEEMAVKFPTVAKTLAKGSLVEIWNDPNNSAIALKNNPDINIVLAPYTYSYLDCGGSNFLGNYTGNNWCPYVSWQQAYSFDPSAVIANATAVLAKDEKLVRQSFVGGEMAVWTEQIDRTNLDSRVWPRAAAGAEIWWTGETVGGKKRDKVEALSRILDLRWRLVARGVGAEPLQPQWCATRPGGCNMH